MPPDETLVVERLCSTFGLRLLIDELTENGRPHIANAPIQAARTQLPNLHGPTAVPRVFVFWCEELGPIRTLGEAPPPADPVDKVARLMTVRQTGRWADLVDLSRTPVIRWRRSQWHEQNRVTPSALQAMALKLRDQPPELTRLHGRINRALQKEGRRINPFEHCSDLPHGRPANENWAVAWALPAAATWIGSGGEVWPWDA